MTEENRSRRPSSARPRRAPRTGASPDGAGAVHLADLSEPSLGDVSFDEWFETPVFESDPDERLEELATSRRGPLRLAANTFLRLNARANQVRHRTDGGDLLGADALRSVDPNPVFEEVEPVPAPRPRASTTRTKPTATTTPAAATTTKAKAPGTNGNAATTRTRASATNGKATTTAATAKAKAPGTNGRATTTRTRTTGAHSRTATAKATGAPLAPETTTATAAPTAAAPLRQRLGQVLDRWAEREAATQIRLERMILPKRWQA